MIDLGIDLTYRSVSEFARTRSAARSTKRWQPSKRNIPNDSASSRFSRCPTSSGQLQKSAMLSGTTNRFPIIRFVLSQTEGILPFLRWRLSYSIPFVKSVIKDPTLRVGCDAMKKSVPEYLSHMEFDTALYTDRYELDLVEDMSQDIRSSAPTPSMSPKRSMPSR